MIPELEPEAPLPKNERISLGMIRNTKLRSGDPGKSSQATTRKCAFGPQDLETRCVIRWECSSVRSGSLLCTGCCVKRNVTLHPEA